MKAKDEKEVTVQDQVDKWVKEAKEWTCEECGTNDECTEECECYDCLDNHEGDCMCDGCCDRRIDAAEAMRDSYD